MTNEKRVKAQAKSCRYLSLSLDYSCPSAAHTGVSTCINQTFFTSSASIVHLSYRRSRAPPSSSAARVTLVMETLCMQSAVYSPTGRSQPICAQPIVGRCGLHPASQRSSFVVHTHEGWRAWKKHPSGRAGERYWSYALVETRLSPPVQLLRVPPRPALPSRTDSDATSTRTTRSTGQNSSSAHLPIGCGHSRHTPATCLRAYSK
ncbi:hypothetical protein FA95DRAFT_671651 [Auriscalpium vulgare]|uniref:Uncharacterized protein n=1 Tax=Auriscalpium vulgare TaxID=40419 RepID=A0ACB8RCJ4_9AGAM|nr:hypothetical protein FA95DRAFT_671651 [Auriscalpium vulgare]